MDIRRSGPPREVAGDRGPQVAAVGIFRAPERGISCRAASEDAVLVERSAQIRRPGDPGLRGTDFGGPQVAGPCKNYGPCRPRWSSRAARGSLNSRSGDGGSRSTTAARSSGSAPEDRRARPGPGCHRRPVRLRPALRRSSVPSLALHAGCRTGPGARDGGADRAAHGGAGCSRRSHGDGDAARRRPGGVPARLAHGEEALDFTLPRASWPSDPPRSRACR